MARSFLKPQITTATASTIMNNAPAVFGTDLVFFLAREFGLEWNPPKLPNYFVSELSPFDLPMQKAAIKLVRRRNVDYNVKYESLVNPEDDDKLVQFLEYVQLVLSTMVDENKDEAYIFLHLVYIARLSLVFYERGTRDALVFTSTLICHAMVHLNFKTRGQIYRILSNFAAKVTEEQG